MAHFLMMKWSFEEITSTYAISETEGIQLLARLDRMKFIHLLPGNRVRLLISDNFEWIPNGPIQGMFKQQAQGEFFDSNFSADDEYQVFVSSMLTRDSRLELIRRLQLVADEFHQTGRNDEKVPLTEKKGTSLSIAIRPWSVKVYESMRRNKSET